MCTEVHSIDIYICVHKYGTYYRGFELTNGDLLAALVNGDRGLGLYMYQNTKTKRYKGTVAEKKIHINVVV